jgi:Type II CAAX prenyl endopeptidase Rce1-like
VLRRRRVPVPYYCYALGLPPLLYGLVDLVLALLGYEVDPSLLAERAPAYLATLVFVAVLGGGLEEPGWRGFALPRLEHRYTPVVATLILGLAWGVWHVPLYGPLGFVVPLVLAFFYTWLYNRTGSVLLRILLHASFTPAQDHLVLLPDDVVDAGQLGRDRLRHLRHLHGRCVAPHRPDAGAPGSSARTEHLSRGDDRDHVGKVGRILVGIKRRAEHDAPRPQAGAGSAIGMPRRRARRRPVWRPPLRLGRRRARRRPGRRRRAT